MFSYATVGRNSICSNNLNRPFILRTGRCGLTKKPKKILLSIVNVILSVMP